MTIPPTARPRDKQEPLRRIQVGEVAVYPLLQLHYRIDPARFFPQIGNWPVRQGSWYLQAPYVEDDAFAIDMGGFLVRTPDRTILIDAGVGNDKRRPNPNFDSRQDDWLDLFELAGVSVESVDTVIFTHLHVDHVGFATSLRDGKWVPTFPEATYHTTGAELDYWTSAAAEPELARLGDYISDSVLPLIEARALSITPPDAVISDDVRLIPAPGHTPGNVCVEVESDGARAVFAGDMIHHAIQLAFPHKSTDYCIDEDAATNARERLLDGLAPGDLLFPSHFPGSLPGRVTPNPDGGYLFAQEPGVAV